MKKIMLAFIGILSLTFVSCSKDDNEEKSQITNFWTLSKENKTLYDNDTEGVKLTVTLAYTPESDITLTPSMTGDQACLEAFELSTKSVKIAKGTKTAEFAVRAKANKMLSAKGSLTIGFEDLPNMNRGETLTVSAEPKISVELTEGQMKMVSKWQEKFGIDMRQFLGALKVKTTITFGDDDKAQFNNGENQVVFENDPGIVTVSDEGTDDQIVLCMSTNPMGMVPFMRNMFEAVTLKDETYWQANPYAQALLPLVKDKTDINNFVAMLDNIVVDPAKKTLAFVAPNEEGTMLVPFVYSYPAWEALVQMAAEGKEVEVDEGESSATYPISDLLNSDGTLNPYYYLGNSDVSEDVYGGSNFIEPAGTFNLSDNTMTFSFSWDFGAGSWLYDYVKVNVVYTLNK